LWVLVADLFVEEDTADPVGSEGTADPVGSEGTADPVGSASDQLLLRSKSVLENLQRRPLNPGVNGCAIRTARPHKAKKFADLGVFRE